MKAYKQDSLQNILIYGAPGSGKTYLSSMVAKEYYTLLFDIDLGARTTQNLPKEVSKNLVIVQYTKFKDLNDIYTMLSKHNTVDEWNSFFKKNGVDITVEKPFEAVIIDTISELQRHMENELGSATLKNKLGSLGDIKPLRIQDWGAISNLTESIVADAFGKLPLIFIGTAHEQMIENENVGEVFGTPKLRGKLAFDIGKHFDLMGRITFAKSGQRVLITRTEKKWQAKSRDAIDSIIANPDINKILKGVK